ncbi:MAG TPA: NAD(P)/FAD-dependent oxidoreductase [Acidimicrobiales bacterium]|nr:NAD(P)/FAD-dependent oxidoreductase [Acidimicrobiales bacterium]
MTPGSPGPDRAGAVAGPRALPARVDVAVVGTGFAGIGMAIRLRRAGREDFVVLERADDLGGTWRDNSYPGAACDIPSHLYSFSFALNPNWSRAYSPQPEIQRYLRTCVDRFGLGRHLYFGHEVLEATWDEVSSRWTVRTPGGELTCRVLVWASGPLSQPVLPDVEGLDRFAGRWFHTAAWDHDYDLTDKSVAVVGTGASAIQVVPAIQPLVRRLTVYQRNAPWVVPRRDHPIPPARQRLLGRLPVVQRLGRAWMYWTRELVVPVLMNTSPARRARAEALARAHLDRQVPDPALLAALTPTYQMGCKRILISDDYYPALARPGVELVSAPVTGLGPHSVRDADGGEREVDAVIFATGFAAAEPAFATRLRGRGGRCLADAWAQGMEAYLGTTVSGFPNLFVLVGPNTVLGHNSMVFIIESQLNYVMDFLAYAARHGEPTAEVRAKVETRYNRQLQARLATSVWNTGGCASWYLDHRGHNTTLWPGYTVTFRRRTRRFRPGDYVLTAPGEPAGAL